MRTIHNHDVATGTVSINDVPFYSSEGPSSVFNVTNELHTLPQSQCYTLNAPQTCTDEQIAALSNGTAVVKNYIVTSPSGVRPTFPQLGARGVCAL